MKFVALAVGVALAASFEGVAAQQPWPVALEGSIGVVKGYTAETDYYDRTPTHIALESLVSARVATWQKLGVVVAVAAAAQGIPRDSICRSWPSNPARCRPHFPDFAAIAALIGIEDNTATFRMAAGPAVVLAESRRAAGWQARSDYAVRLFSHLSMTLSGRLLIIPKYDSDSFGTAGVSVGMRLR